MDRLELAVTATVQWAKAPRSVVVDIVVGNHGPREILLVDRLWVAKPKGVRVWDPAGAYRFVGNGWLRLFYGPPPIPANTLVGNRQLPDLTRVLPGQEVTRRVELTDPIQEYNVLDFPRGAEAVSFTPVRVEQIDVLVQFVVPEEGVEMRPSLVDRGVMSLAFVPEHVHSAHARVTTAPFEAWRRADANFARVNLSGD